MEEEQINQPVVKAEETGNSTPSTGDIVPQFQDVPFYPLLKVGILNAGLPLFAALPTHAGRQGETVLCIDSGVKKICSYINGSWACVDIGLQHFNFSGTQVFDGNCPDLTWTDLDISAVVGANSAVALLAVINTGGTATRYAFKKKGAGGVVLGLASGFLANNYPADFADDGVMYVVVPTNTSGVISWSGNRVTNTTIAVECYLK